MGLLPGIISATENGVRHGAQPADYRLKAYAEGGLVLNNDFHTTVQLVPWTPDWEKRFQEEKAAISSAFEKIGLLPAQIHHTGSTSIRGMWSKPIIDVLVIIPNDKGVEDYEEALIGIGYSSLGECGRRDRVFLTKGDSPNTAFYLHLTYADNPVAQDQLLFQFIERALPDIARAYQLFKAQVAVEYANDRRGYTNAKAPFIQSVLSAYRLGAKRLEHKGFTGSIEYSKEDGLFYGQVQNTEDLISYHGEDIVALEQGFKDTVDDYLEFLSDSSFQDEIIKIARQKGSSKSDSQ